MTLHFEPAGYSHADDEFQADQLYLICDVCQGKLPESEAASFDFIGDDGQLFENKNVCVKCESRIFRAAAT